MRRLLRLLCVCPPPEAPGGVARSADRLVRALRAAGHRVLTLHPDADVFPNEQLQAGDSLRFGALEPARPADWIAPVRACAEAYRPDLLLGYYGTLWGYAAACSGWPTVLCLRGNDVDRDAADPERGPGLRAALAAAAAITAVSTEMVAKVAALGHRAHFIANSVDPERFFPEPAAGAAFRARHHLQGPVAGIFGQIKPKRGVEALAASGATAGWTVAIIGSVRPGTHLPAGWRRLGSCADDASLRAAYSACDVVLQPSLADGMPNVALEAMACGRPVIARPVGGLVDLIQPGISGLLCDGPAAWRAALAAARERPLRLGPAARARLPTPAQERAAFEAVFAAALGRLSADRRAGSPR